MTACEYEDEYEVKKNAVYFLYLHLINLLCHLI